MAETTEFKKIIEVKFPIRIKKGKVFVGAVESSDGHIGLIRKVLTVADNVSMGDECTPLVSIHDGRNYEIWLCPLKNVHLTSYAKWIDLNTLDSKREYGNDELSDVISLYRVMFEHFDMMEGSSSVASRLDKYFSVFKELLYEQEKRKYVAEIKAYINGYIPTLYDAYMKPMDKELLRKELDTLEHFKLVELKSFNLGADSEEDCSPAKVMSRFSYSYDIDYKAFGGGIVGIDIFSRSLDNLFS